MENQIIKSLEHSCKQLSYSYEKVPSGAGHDSMNMAKLCPTGMIFIPSKDGISHNPKEFSSLEDISRGVNLLKNEILKTAIPLNL